MGRLFLDFHVDRPHVDVYANSVLLLVRLLLGNHERLAKRPQPLLFRRKLHDELRYALVWPVLALGMAVSDQLDKFQRSLSRRHLLRAAVYSR